MNPLEQSDKLNLWSYAKLNTDTTKFYFQVTSLTFTVVITLLFLVLKYAKGFEEGGLRIFLMGEMTGLSLTIFMYVVIIIKAYSLCKATINKYNSLPNSLVKQFELKLFMLPRNPKWEFFELGIGQETENGVRFFIDENYHQWDLQSYKNLFKP